MMFYRSPVEMSSVVYADGMAYIYWIYFTFGFDYTPSTSLKQDDHNMIRSAIN
jgi:hypothetical protein